MPPSDICRTKPLVRLILNQIGRRLTEQLQTDNGAPQGAQLLLMLDEFPALGRLDFFETSLAFMAGYGVRAFLIAQCLNQIDKAYGENNAILDNCHVRVAFATNDERTAKRISDALGTATEQRAMRNYAGHRLAPWLAHVMVSRQETARPLLTPGEVMQLPPTDELVLVSGLPPIRATQASLFRGPQLHRPRAAGAGARHRRYADRPARGRTTGPGSSSQRCRRSRPKLRRRRARPRAAFSRSATRVWRRSVRPAATNPAARSARARRRGFRSGGRCAAQWRAARRSRRYSPPMPSTKDRATAAT